MRTLLTRSRSVVALLACLGLGAGASRALAEDAPPSIDVTGFVDSYYAYQFNKTAPQFRNFDVDHNSFSLNLIEVALEKKPTTSNRVGFRADLDFGPTTDIVHSYEPQTNGKEVFKHLEQAYVSYLSGSKLQFDVGKFVTHHGAEVIETKDNWNYSRSLLFALAIPYYHSGVRATYTASDKVTLAAHLVNGWNNTVDTNDDKSFGAQIMLKPNSKFTFVQNYMGGVETVGGDARHLFDTVATFSPTSKLSLMANVDYGKEGAVTWSGVAAYARAQLNDSWALIPRFEVLQDDDGFMTVGGDIQEFTLTLEKKVGDGLLTRLEYRTDFADDPIFHKGSGKAVKTQSGVTFGIVYAFGSKL